MIPLEARKVKDDARRDRNRTGKEKRVDLQTISTFLGREEGAVSLPGLGNWKRLHDDKYGIDLRGRKWHISTRLLTQSVGYPSGQRGQTVNLLDNSFQRSNR